MPIPPSPPTTVIKEDLLRSVLPAPTLEAPHPIVLPGIRTVSLLAPLSWLRLGWLDIWRQPVPSLLYGVVLLMAGAAILLITEKAPYMFVAAVTGFVLVAPMLAAGLYEKSRRYLANEPAPFITFTAAWRRDPSSLYGFSFLSLLAGTAWQLISVVLLALFYKGSAMTPIAMIVEVLIKPEYTLFFMVYISVGGALAALIFAASVVSVPMMVDRQCDLLAALVTSFSAVSENPLPLVLWAIIIMLLTGLGFVTVIGFVFVMPLLGHASFHAYKELVE